MGTTTKRESFTMNIDFDIADNPMVWVMSRPGGEAQHLIATVLAIIATFIVILYIWNFSEEKGKRNKIISVVKSIVAIVVAVALWGTANHIVDNSSIEIVKADETGWLGKGKPVSFKMEKKKEYNKQILASEALKFKYKTPMNKTTFIGYQRAGIPLDIEDNPEVDTIELRKYPSYAAKINEALKSHYGLTAFNDKVVPLISDPESIAQSAKGGTSFKRKNGSVVSCALAVSGEKYTSINQIKGIKIDSVVCSNANNDVQVIKPSEKE